MLTEIIKSNIDEQLKKERIRQELVKLKKELNLLKSGEKSNNPILVDRNKKRKEEIENIIFLLEDLKKDLQINNISNQFFKIFKISELKGNQIVATKINSLKEKIKIKINGIPYTISSYMEIYINSYSPTKNIIIINGKIYEIDINNKKIQISKVIQMDNNMGLYIKGPSNYISQMENTNTNHSNKTERQNNLSHNENNQKYQITQKPGNSNDNPKDNANEYYEELEYEELTKTSNTLDDGLIIKDYYNKESI